jgi:RNA polymerase sigma factor (sigma-70 family)
MVSDRPQIADAQLVERIAAGDGEAFAALYDRHLPLVLAFLMRQSGDPELAADLAAETFAAALLGAGRYREKRPSAAPWLLGIARNKLLESLRRGRIEARARRRLAFEPLALEDSDLERVAALADEGSRSMDELLAQLPPAERAAVVARVLNERSYGEIAREMRCSEMVVRKRVSRGLRRLRDRLEEDS